MQPEEYGRVSLELAGDELTPAQICEAYSKAQGSNVSHFSPPKFLFWFLNRLVSVPPSKSLHITMTLTEIGYLFTSSRSAENLTGRVLGAAETCTG
jgi:hypothetical protein